MRVVRGGDCGVFSARTALLAAFVFALTAVAAVAGLSKDDVYYGNHRKFKRPAEVNAKKVFMAIPSYKEIVEKDIKKDSALYIAKLSKANKVFLKAVKKYAEANKFDLVCEEGALKKAHNATDDVVKIVKQMTKE